MEPPRQRAVTIGRGESDALGTEVRDLRSGAGVRQRERGELGARPLGPSASHRLDLREAAESGPLEIRAALESDIEEVMMVERRAFGAAGAPGRVTDFLASNVAELHVLAPPPAGAPVAYLCTAVQGDELLLLSLATDPAHQRRGYARRLLGWAVQYGRSLGLAYLSLEVAKNNRGAIALYRQMGFTTVGVLPLYYADTGGEDAFKMLRPLARDGDDSKRRRRPSAREGRWKRRRRR